MGINKLLNKMEDPEIKYITPAEAAKYLSVSIMSIYRYVEQLENPLKCYRLNEKNIKLTKQDIDEWMKNFYSVKHN